MESSPRSSGARSVSPVTTPQKPALAVSDPPPDDTGQSGRPQAASPGSALDDVESFTGKIVYNPDGSAYIIEGGSDGSDVESEVGSMLPLNQEGSIVDRAGCPVQGSSGCSSSDAPSTASAAGRAMAAASNIPQVVSAFHISRSSPAALQGIYSALYGQATAANQLLQENLKVPEVPIMHSYRVFTLRDRDAPAQASSDTNAEGDANNNLDELASGSDPKEDGSDAASSGPSPTVPVKPILMCFICKISFGYAKSFVAHAMSEHQLALIDAERRLLAQKNTSAIIQGVGKDKEPLLSFLEPKNKTPQPLLPSSLAGLAANLNQLSAAAAVAANSNSTGPTSSGATPLGGQGSLHQQFQQQLEAAQQRLMAAAQAAASAALRQGSAGSSSSVDGGACRESPSRPSSNGSLNLVLPKSGDELDETSGRASRQGTPGAGEDSSQLTPELADLANLEKMAKAAAAAIQQQSEETREQLLAAGAAGGHYSSAASPKMTQALTNSPFVCAQHPEGKVPGVECPKCDTILGSSRSLGGHMTMMHSRNSCKTLKCPKCNWHYKYQETLEIHMKEKHPENEMNCIYCLTNQAHPRLARGETYTCGYKPYRCEVCNYSTTTKGNLSIHMQSDKHINNVQEIQNGNIPAEHLLQSQALAQAAAAAAAASASKSGSANGPNGSNASSPGAPSGPADKASPVVVPGGPAPPPAPVAGPQAKPKATWRCDVCNYETNVARNLRIHMTSEKHTHNMMVLQQNVKHMQQLSALQQAGILAGGDPMFQFHPGLFAALAGAGGAPSGGASIPGAEGLQPEAALADMAYNHALLMMASQHQQQRAMAAMMQQQQQQLQAQQQSQQGKQQQASMAAALGNMNAAAAAAALGAFGGQNAPGSGQPIVDLEHPDPSLRFDSVPYEEACRLFQCCVCTVFTCDSVEGLSQHIQQDRTRLREDEVLMAVGGSYICKLCSYKTNLKANFQLHCKTDKHLQRLQQVNHIKEGSTRTEWKLKYVNVSNPIQVRCNLCDYYTNSIHKLQLHTANPRHEASARIFLHLQLSETLVKSQNRDAEKTFYFNCNLCQHATRSKVGLLHHIHTIKHMQQENLRQLKLQQQPHQAKSLDEEIRDIFQVKECLPGDHINFADNEFPPTANSNIAFEEVAGQSPSQRSTPSSQMQMDPALAAALGMDSSSMLKQALIEQQQAAAAAAGVKSEPMPSPSQENTNACPYCNYTCASEVKLQMHVLNAHAKQSSQERRAKPMLCPLCQEGFHVRAKLESHLMDVHNVTKEGVQRLLLIVDQTGDLISGLDKKRADDNEDSSSTGADNADGKSDCSGDSSRDDMMNIDQQAAKFLKLGGGVPAAVSDRHVYKYRCNQCSLAFKTMEKLQLHSQYHLIRAATQCVLCGRSFRSVEALQKHVESTHQDMTEEELESYRQSLANNPLLMSGPRNGGGGVLDPSTTELLKKESNRLEDLGHNEEEAMDLAAPHTSSTPPADEPMEQDAPQEGGQNSLEDYLNSQAVAEDSYNDPTRKYKCHRCKVAFTRQSYLTSHNKTLLHRKGEKLSYPMEKYLDPNRPYKCDICKESFTQKNILLVHYNSVSHLHKLKQAMKESSNTNSVGGEQAAQATAVAVAPAALAVALPATSSPSEAATNNSSSPSAPNGNNASSFGSATTDFDKKPFRCNICKVAYNLGSTLDIHVRSVLHQTRASKLHELAITGQIDLNQPLIERPDSEQLSPTDGAQTKIDQGKPDTPSPCSTPKAMDPFPAGLGLAEQQLQQQLQQQAVAQMLLGQGSVGQAAGGVFPCQRCGAVFASQETSIQHQQLCALFGPTSANALLQSQQVSQKEQAEGRPQTASDQLAALRSANKFYSAPICRSKPPVYKHLLETWGFECVMQFNEHHQKRRRVKDEAGEAEKKEQAATENVPNNQPGNDVNGGNASEVKTSEKAADGEADEAKVNTNLPEINRSKCDVCQKEFSSIWVLKAHKEEIHKQVVPLDLVEHFADDYRKDYERRVATREQEAEVEAPAPSVEPPPKRPTPVHTPAEPVTPVASANSNRNTPPLSAAQSAANSQAGQDMNAASQMAAQLQFSQLLMSMGLAGMGMPMGMNMNMPFAAAAAMGLPPQMMGALMMSGQFDPVMAAAFGQHQQNQNSMAPPTPGPAPAASSSEPNYFAAQQKLLQQQQQQLSAAQQQKRARTRITDDQLKILRQYFDINNSPTEEHLQEMSEKSGLPLKVIKHWFRNTLFKERQRNKDSPYNFNNPPSTFLNLEEYEKTGEAKVTAIDGAARDLSKEEKQKPNSLETGSSNNLVSNEVKQELDQVALSKSVADQHLRAEEHVKAEAARLRQLQEAAMQLEQANADAQAEQNAAAAAAVAAANAVALPAPSHRDSFDYAKSFSMSPHSDSSMSSVSTNDIDGSQHAQQQPPLYGGLPAFAAAAGIPASALGASPALQLAIDAAHRSQVAAAAAAANNPQTPGGNSPGHASSNSNSGPGKRANRTRFTDYQIKVLQEFFESNAYPKDDDLEYLSKLLNLSPRVIVVWFQNARQKARKVYENQPAAVSEEETSPGRFQRTPGLNYQCKKCMQVFQRYYELIKHQKSACFKDENPLAVQIKAAQEARQNSASPGAASTGASNSSTAPDTSKVSSQAQAAQSPSNGAFRCEKCSLVFTRFDLWREHQLVHLMNPNLFPNYPPTSPFGILQIEAQQQQQQQQQQQHEQQNNAVALIPAHSGQNFPPALPQTPTGMGGQNAKRKLPEDEDSRDSISGSQSGSVGNNSEQPRDKRLRTTILPEQLDYLYQKYQIESNPSRKMLENIAKEVGLKKRVVQVWFQNTRARERKGQFRAHQQVIHKRCPFCRALFKARSALESHLATRHADQYTKGDINIDALPDGDPNEDGPMEDSKSNIPPELLQMKQFYENSQYLKKYIDDIAAGQGNEVALTPEINLNMKSSMGETPLDLSKPVDLSRPLMHSFGNFGGNDDDGGFDSRSEAGDSESESDDGGLPMMDLEQYGSNPNSPAPGSTTSSVTSPAAVGGNGHARNSGSSNSGGNKRFRTQMTTVQLKVMKSVFADYKTPSMTECETLGRELGLPKRVVQVWFQNARAKEKKARLAFAKSFGHEMPEQPVKAPEECKVCCVKYNLKFSSTSMQDHLFSHKHLENLKTHIDSVKKFGEGPNDDSVDFPGASTIVMPNAGNTQLAAVAPTDENENRSKSAANLMQQLQMMGLASALQGVPGLGEPGMTAINGGANENQTSVKPSKKEKSSKLVTNPSPKNLAVNMSQQQLQQHLQNTMTTTTSNGGGGNEDSDKNGAAGDESANNPFGYMYPGLQNYYAAAGALFPTAIPQYNASGQQQQQQQPSRQGAQRQTSNQRALAQQQQQQNQVNQPSSAQQVNQFAYNNAQQLQQQQQRQQQQDTRLGQFVRERQQQQQEQQAALATAQLQQLQQQQQQHQQQQQKGDNTWWARPMHAISQVMPDAFASNQMFNGYNNTQRPACSVTSAVPRIAEEADFWAQANTTN